MNALVFCAALLAACAAANAQTASGPLTVASAWARASAPHATSAAVYLTVTDTGAPDRLTGAATPVAADATVHESRMVGGVMQMRPVGTLDIASGGTISLAPGGLHLMLTGLKAPLQAGQRFPLTLQFEKAGPVVVDVAVEKIGAAGPGDAMGDMKMPMGNGP